jgi:hypothetical protein
LLRGKAKRKKSERAAASSASGSGPKPVFWVGSNNGASIVKLETLD